MDISKYIAIGMTLLAPLFISAHASEDVCNKMPGHWQGIYTLKNQHECKLYNGCTHVVTADVSYVSNNDYHLSLKPVVGHGGEFTLQCKNGEVISPIPKSTVRITCDEWNHCSVIYEDARLTSEMVKS